MSEMDGKKFEVDFEMQVTISLEKPEAIKAYFIDGDWKESFYDLDDLEDFVRSLSCAFISEDDHYDRDMHEIVRVPEGYGTYVRGARPYIYTLDESSADEIGSQITICISEELEPSFVTENQA